MPARMKTLPATVPVEMPVLPATMPIRTQAQLRALSDPLRTRILAVIQNQPATAKQVADRLRKSPGSIGYQLKLLEKAGLAQVVALRMSRGFTARYYTRSARMYDFGVLELGPAMRRDQFGRGLQIAVSELEEAMLEDPGAMPNTYYLRVRLSDARAAHYAQRLDALKQDLLAEPGEANGRVRAIAMALFTAPAYLQTAS
jgi:DNA-binding transcriptional ArsR family regulator